LPSLRTTVTALQRGSTIEAASGNEQADARHGERRAAHLRALPRPPDAALPVRLQPENAMETAAPKQQVGNCVLRRRELLARVRRALVVVIYRRGLLIV